jgi:hypothetical protein
MSWKNALTGNNEQIKSFLIMRWESLKRALDDWNLSWTDVQMANYGDLEDSEEIDEANWVAGQMFFITEMYDNFGWDKNELEK